jgi:outer membrane protein OmpA-like peptidoglycan-associated protein
MGIGLKILALLPFLIAVGTPATGGLLLSCSPGPFIIFFEHSSSKLDSDSATILNNAVNQRGDCGEMQALIAGYTDTSERRELSKMRAATARAYMIKRGMPKRDTTIRWYGSDRMRVPTPPRTAEAQNRRVEIIYGPVSR